MPLFWLHCHSSQLIPTVLPSLHYSTPSISLNMSQIYEIAPLATSGETNTFDIPTGGLPIGNLPEMHQSYRLDRQNYLQWTQLVKTFLKGREKLDHLTAPSPSASDPEFTAWDIKDSMIMLWLWNAMQPEVSRNYMFLSTAKDI